MALDPHIPEIGSYNDGMAKSMIDKIYFMDKIDAEVIVDFGCANGVMLKQLAVMFPAHTYMGFDASEKMLELAREDNPHDIFFTTQWAEMVASIKNTKGKKAIVLSSIIHEVYSYCSEREIAEFWDRVFNTGFDYIVIREMMVSKTTSRPSDPLSVARIRQCFNKHKIQEWENIWGSITENGSLVHFLLTYRYETNWEREYKENYLPVTLEDFMPMIPKQYFPTFFEHYTLPFVRNQVEKDFGVQLQDRTHLKLILENR